MLSRSHQVKAPIVKIMKGRKQLKYTALVELVAQDIRVFSVEPKFLKMQLEELITNEYVKRTDTDNAALEYIA